VRLVLNDTRPVSNYKLFNLGTSQRAISIFDLSCSFFEDVQEYHMGTIVFWSQASDSSLEKVYSEHPK
jgi:hypothetical protein